MNPTREQVLALRAEFPFGTKVRLDFMDDVNAPPVGTTGYVAVVDDVGTIHVDWDNGSGLGIVYGVDKITKID